MERAEELTFFPYKQVPPLIDYQDVENLGNEKTQFGNQHVQS